MKVLLVEDNPVSRMVIELQLDTLCCEVKTVTDGEMALGLLQSEKFDLVLMDVEMPKMDGITATRLIRNPASGVLNSRVKIVAMTAHNREEDKRRCLRAGMDDHVAKPLNSEQLKVLLKIS